MFIEYRCEKTYLLDLATVDTDFIIVPNLHSNVARVFFDLSSTSCETFSSSINSEIFVLLTQLVFPVFPQFLMSASAASMESKVMPTRGNCASSIIDLLIRELVIPYFPKDIRFLRFNFSTSKATSNVVQMST